MAVVIEKSEFPDQNIGRPSIYDDVINKAIDAGTYCIQAENIVELRGIKARLYAKGYRPRCRDLMVLFSKNGKRPRR